MIRAASPVRQLGLTLLTALLVVSCNTGGGGLVASGGIGGTGVTAVSVGPITQFGSIFVNGVEYDLTNATIQVNGSPVGTTGENGNQVALKNLAIGQVVKVTGTVDSSGTKGSATQVAFNADVNGPIRSGSIQSVDANTKELTVLGQSVVVDKNTKFVGTIPSTGRPFSFDDVKDNMVVEVSGLTNAGGKLHATYLKFEEENAIPNTTQVDVKGTIQSLNSNGTFKINSQTVNYVAHGPTFEGLPHGGADLADGLVVEVEGIIDANGVLQAQKISLESESGSLGSGEAQSADIEGFITNFTSATSAFTVNSQQVKTTASTAYVGGLAADLGAGVKVEVKGTLQNGLLTAAKIIFKDDVELEANVASVDPSGKTLTLAGLPGITVNVNSLTQLGGNMTFPLSTSLQGYVKIRGRADSGGTSVTATELEPESASTDITLQGPVQNINSTIVTILGIQVNADSVGSFSSGESSPTKTQFLGALQTGDLVKVSGSFKNSVLTWDEMELEK